MSDELQSAISRCRKGDSAAFKVIVRIFERRVLAIAYSILGNSDEALEVMQETFYRVYKNIRKLKNESGFSSFVCKVAANYAIDLKRRGNGRHVSLDDGTDFSTSLNLQLSDRRIKPDMEVERNELWAALKSAVADLPDRQRTTLVLHDIDGLSKAEIGKILDCPQGTVRSNLHIARKKLQEKLKEHYA